MEDMVDTKAMEVMVMNTVADMEVMVDTEAMVADTDVMVVGIDNNLENAYQMCGSCSCC
jgi:hypothetical protein